MTPSAAVPLSTRDLLAPAQFPILATIGIIPGAMSY